MWTERWLALGLTLVALAGCDKKSDDGDSAKKTKKTGFSLDERGREETRTRPHVSGRAVRSDLQVVVRVTEAPDDVAEKVQQGFCRAIKTLWKTECSGPLDDVKVRAWVSEVDIQLREVAGSIVVDLIGETLLNEGWETADLRLRYGVDGKAPEGKDEAVELGVKLGRTWTRELDAYLKKMVKERPPSDNVQWVAAPGFMREDTWPLDYGFAEIVAGRTWTFQRGKKTKERVGYLIDDKGGLLRSESFETTESEARLAGWGTRADEQRRATVLALPLTAADKKAVDHNDLKGDPSGPVFAVVVLTRGGEARMVGRDSGFPMSPPVILSSGDVALVTSDPKAVYLNRLEGMSGKGHRVRLPPGLASNTARYDLLLSKDDLLFVVPTTPGTKVLAARAPAPPPPGAATAPAAEGAAPVSAKQLAAAPRVVYTYRTPPSSDATQRHTRLAALTTNGALALMDGDQLVVVEPDGKQRFTEAMGAGVLELAAAGDVLAVLQKNHASFVDAATGKVRGTDKRKVQTIVAVDGAKKGYVACAEPGVVHYDGAFKPMRAVRLDDHCEDLAVLPGGDVIAARFLWAARLDAPEKWPTLK